MRKQKDQNGIEGIQKRNSKERSEGNIPNLGYNNPNVQDENDFPEMEIVNEDEEFSSTNSDVGPI